MGFKKVMKYSFGGLAGVFGLAVGAIVADSYIPTETVTGEVSGGWVGQGQQFSIIADTEEYGHQHYVSNLRDLPILQTGTYELKLACKLQSSLNLLPEPCVVKATPIPKPD